MTQQQQNGIADPIADPKWVSIAAAAQAMGIAERNVRKALGQGRLRGRQVPGSRGGRSGLVWEVAVDSLPAVAQRRLCTSFSPGGCQQETAPPTGAVVACPSGIAVGLPSTAVGRPTDVLTPSADIPPAEGVLFPAADGHVLDLDDPRLDERMKVAWTRHRMIAPILALRTRERGREIIINEIAERENISRATLYRWCEAYRRGGVTALAEAPRSDRRQARWWVSREWDQAMTGILTAQAARQGGAESPLWLLERIGQRLTGTIRSLWAKGAPSARQCALLASEWLIGESIKAGMPESLARRVCQVNRRKVNGERSYALVWQAEHDAKAVYDRHDPGVRRRRDDLAPGMVVWGDVSPLDIPVRREDGSTAYARIIAWQDAASNWLYFTAHLCAKGKGIRREHVALSFARMCAEAPFGLPETLYLDNGSEYQWEEMLGGWQQLAILTGRCRVAVGGQAEGEAGRIVRTRAFKPRGKALEGQFGNLRFYLGWHPAFQGGNRLAKKTANLGRAIEPADYEEVLTFLGDALALYHGSPQQGHLKGKAPAEIIQEYLDQGWTPYQADETALMLAFAERYERRVVGGRVSINGLSYYDGALLGIDGMRIVRVARHDPRFAFVFDGGRLLAAAALEPRFGLLDEAGAEEAGRRAGALRKIIARRRGMLSGLEDISPQDLMRQRAERLGVDAVVERAAGAAGQVEISAEAQAMVAAVAQKAQEVVAELGLRADPARLSQWTVTEDPEVAELRKLLGIDEESDNG